MINNSILNKFVKKQVKILCHYLCLVNDIFEDYT